MRSEKLTFFGMFGCVKRWQVCHRWLASASCVVAFSVPALAQSTSGFPVDEPKPAPAPELAPQPPPAVQAAPLPPMPAPPPASAELPLPTAAAATAAPSVPTRPSTVATLPPFAPTPETAPFILPYRKGVPIPTGYHVQSRAATGLIATGLVTMSVGYLVAIGVGLENDFDGSMAWLLLPVAGPWPAITGRKLTCVAVSVDDARICLDRAYREATTIAVVAVDGMLQATGLMLWLAGLASGREELVRDDLRAVRVSLRRRHEGGFDLGLRGQF